jgi:hypothetical protein
VLAAEAYFETFEFGLVQAVVLIAGTKVEYVTSPARKKIAVKVIISAYPIRIKLIFLWCNLERNRMSASRDIIYESMKERGAFAIQ